MAPRPLHWISSSLKDIRDFPEDVKDEAGFALYLAQAGDKAANAMPLVGFGSARVLEIVINNEGDTYRTVYTVKFERAVYVLHAFQKKSKRGNATPKADMDLVRSRLRIAEEHYRANYEIAKKERTNEKGAGS